MNNPQSDAYLQVMNDNLHKKFRRSNHIDPHFTALNPTSTEYSHTNNPLYYPPQLNGDYKSNMTKPSNGSAPTASKPNNDDDDDDIVLVSDDDSDEEKSETKSNSMSFHRIIEKDRLKLLF